MKAKPLLALTLVAVVAGCGEPAASSSGEAAKAPAATAQKTPERRETVFDPWVGTIERAKGVQNTVDEQAAEQRRKIDEAAR